MNMSFRRILLLFILLMSTNLYADVDKRMSNALVDSFRSAIVAQDLNALMGHVYWKDVEDNIRQSVEVSLKDMLTMNLKSIEVVPLGKDDIFQFERNGTTYATNLDPVAYLKVAFNVPEPESQIPGTVYIPYVTFPIGEINGSYIITTAAPKQTTYNKATLPHDLRLCT